MKCFYHNDIDGRCAGALVAQYEQNHNREDFYEIDYVTPLPLDVIQPGERVYFVDYSFTGNTVWQLSKILEKTQDIIWIDHHTSSMELEKALPWTCKISGNREEGISGAALTYMWLNQCEFSDLPFFIKLISDYDCWQFEYDPDTTYFKLGLETNAYDALDPVWPLLLEYGAGFAFCDELLDKGEIIKSYVDENNDYYRDHYAYESEIDGLKCLVINKKSNSWAFGDRYDDYPLCMVWVFDGSKYVYSIFSGKEDVNCATIASKFGGGGHKGAAGFSSDKLLFVKEI